MQTKNIKTLIVVICILFGSAIGALLSDTTRAEFEVGGDRGRPSADKTEPYTIEDPLPQTQEPNQDRADGINQTGARTDDSAMESPEDQQTGGMDIIFASTVALLLVVIGAVWMRRRGSSATSRRRRRR